MGLDEALLERAVEIGAPLLRFYAWAEPSVSFGYFDRIAFVRATFLECVPVRRWTGGGAVEHVGDFTFALAIPRAHPVCASPARDSYGLIHAALAAALIRCGITARLSGAEALSPPSRDAAPCFARPVCADVLQADQKIAGGAQRRTRAGLLHQGSVQRVRPELPRAALAREFPTALASAVIAWEPSSAFLATGERLAAERYAHPAWTERY